jgi:ATP-dependent DNA helicase RecG
MTVAFTEILQRLRDQATDDGDVEVKASAKRLSRDVWDSVSAFANTSGGAIIFGLAEEEGFAPAKGFNIDAVRDQFVEGIGDGGIDGAKLTNPPAYGMTREHVDGQAVLVVTISANRPGSRPCYVTAKGLGSGAYKRVDDKDIRLGATEVFAMQHELEVSAADRQVVEEADESDLDAHVIEALIARRQGSRALQGANGRAEQLVRLNILDKSGGVRLAGLLATGAYPQQYFPRLIVDVTVHPGIEKSLPGQPTRFLDRVECAGRLSDVVSEAVDAVVRNLRTYSVIEGAVRTQVPEVPVSVIREAIANAVLHREYSSMFLGQPVTVDVYSDRIEVTNPGGLWGGLTPDSLGDGTSRCRNQTLLPLMQHVSTEKGEGFTVEGQGSGIRLMNAEMQAHALNRPAFTVTPDQVKVTLARHGAEVPEQREWLRLLTDRDMKPHEDVALLIAQRDGHVSVEALRSVLKIDSDAARELLGGLKAEGVLRGVGNESYVLTEGAPLPSDDDQAIIRGLAGKPPQSVHDIVEWSGLSIGSVRARLRQLVEDGWVRATAPPQSRNRKYVAVEE